MTKDAIMDKSKPEARPKLRIINKGKPAVWGDDANLPIANFWDYVVDTVAPDNRLPVTQPTRGARFSQVFNLLGVTHEDYVNRLLEKEPDAPAQFPANQLDYFKRDVMKDGKRVMGKDGKPIRERDPTKLPICSMRHTSSWHIGTQRAVLLELVEERRQAVNREADRIIRIIGGRKENASSGQTEGVQDSTKVTTTQV